MRGVIIIGVKAGRLWVWRRRDAARRRNRRQVRFAAPPCRLSKTTLPKRIRMRAAPSPRGLLGRPPCQAGRVPQLRPHPARCGGRWQPTVVARAGQPRAGSGGGLTAGAAAAAPPRRRALWGVGAPAAAASARRGGRRGGPDAAALAVRGAQPDTLAMPGALVQQIAAATERWTADARDDPLEHAGVRVHLATAVAWAPQQWCASGGRTPRARATARPARALACCCPVDGRPQPLRASPQRERTAAPQGGRARRHRACAPLRRCA